MIFPCLRCGCAGEVTPTGLIFTPCECICCSYSLTGEKCVYSNIDTCKQCKKPFTLQSVKEKYDFLCESTCELFVDYQKKKEEKEEKEKAVPSPTKRSTLIQAIFARNVQLVWELLRDDDVNPFLTDAHGNSAMHLIQTLISSSSLLSVEEADILQQIYDILPKSHSSLQAIESLSEDDPPPIMSRTQSEFIPPTGRNIDLTPASTDNYSGDDTDLPPLPPSVRSISLDRGKASHLQGGKGQPTTPRRIRQGKISTRNFLVEGKQMFTPLTLERITSDTSGGKNDDHNDGDISSRMQKWSLTELNNMIVKQTEVLPLPPHYPSSPSKKQPEQQSQKDSNASALTLQLKECSACLDQLIDDDVRFSCSHMGCKGCLCESCLFRSVFVTITSALYAVPIIRCPGCLRRVPTAVWRGGLHGMSEVEISESDKLALRTKMDGSESSTAANLRLMRLNDQLYEKFEDIVDVVWEDREEGSLYSDEEDDDDNEDNDTEEKESRPRIPSSRSGNNGAAVGDDDLFDGINKAESKSHNANIWKTRASEDDVRGPLHRFFVCVQEMYDVQLQLLGSSQSPASTETNDKSQFKKFEILETSPATVCLVYRHPFPDAECVGLIEPKAFDSKEISLARNSVASSEKSSVWLKVDPTHSETLKLCSSFKEHDFVKEGFIMHDDAKTFLKMDGIEYRSPSGILRDIYNNAIFSGLCAGVEAVLPESIKSFAEFSTVVQPGVVVEKGGIDSFITGMEEKLDTMLDIGEGLSQDASGNEVQHTLDIAKSTLSQFLVDLAIMLRTLGFSHLVSDYEGSDGRVIPCDNASVGESDLDDDSDGETCDDDSLIDDGSDEDEEVEGQKTQAVHLKKNKGYDFAVNMDKEDMLMGSACVSKGAEKLLMEKYLFNAKALLMLRCASCDETNSLFVTKRKKSSNNNSKKPLFNFITLARENRQKLLSQLMKGLSDDNSLQFLKSWNTYCNGGPPNEFITLLVETYTNQLSSIQPDLVSDVKSSLDRGVCKGQSLKYINAAFSLLLDVERRFTAHLEFLRQYPKIYTLCCRYDHCFLCKVEGHHEKKTCQQVQSREMGAACQHCPGCNVPTLRSEGCSEILCVCGKVWEWEGGSGSEDEDTDDDDDDDECELDDDDGSDDRSESQWFDVPASQDFDEDDDDFCEDY